MKRIHRYKKYVSILGFCAYLFVCGYSLFHYHKINYLVDESFAAPVNAVQDSRFHHESFCLLHHFSATQLYSDVNPFPNFEPAKFYLNDNRFTSFLISSEVNSVLKRGPPSLS